MNKFTLILKKDIDQLYVSSSGYQENIFFRNIALAIIALIKEISKRPNEPIITNYLLNDLSTKNSIIKFLQKNLEYKPEEYTHFIYKYVYFYKKDCLIIDSLPTIFDEILELTTKSNGYLNWYTPKRLTNFTAKLVDIQDIKSAYDPACGTAGFLISLYTHNKTSQFDLYGNDTDNDLVSIAKINFLINNLNPDNVYQSSFFKSNYLDEKFFDLIITNPPFSQKTDQEYSIEQYKFYPFGEPSKLNNDFNYLQKSISLLNDKGKLIIVLPTSVLFRSVDSAIRKNIINASILETIILLPNNIFNSNIRTCLIIIDRKSRNQKILFIDYSKENTPEDFIIDIYKKRIEVNEYSHLVNIAEVEANGFDLSINRYLKNSEETDEQSFEELIDKQNKLYKKLESLRQEVLLYMS